MNGRYRSLSTRRWFWFVLLVGCGPYVEDAEVDESLIERECSATCSRLEECSLESREHSECVSGCVASTAWKEGCVEIRSDFMHCLRGSECDELESRADAVLSSDGNLEEEVCYEESLASSICRG